MPYKFNEPRRHKTPRVRGVLKTFGMLPGAMRGLSFDKRVEALLADHDDLAPGVPSQAQ